MIDAVISILIIIFIIIIPSASVAEAAAIYVQQATMTNVACMPVCVRLMLRGVLREG